MIVSVFLLVCFCLRASVWFASHDHVTSATREQRHGPQHPERVHRRLRISQPLRFRPPHPRPTWALQCNAQQVCQHLKSQPLCRFKLFIRYLRYIYNRIILETHQVRSAAVSALARFGACVPSLRADVEELLARCCSDTDDECRDRATFFLMLLRSSNEELVSR